MPAPANRRLEAFLYGAATGVALYGPALALWQ